VVILFTTSVFLAAALLFGIQPMVAKSLLPDFGGGSGVWTASMLFYQTVLIAGYIYAHLLLTRVRRRLQFGLHTLVLVGALAAGWLFDEPTPPARASEFPMAWLLAQLFLVSGLPYFAIASAGPLLQGWFARTGDRRAGDPYFLYAASNAGSLVGLLAYPFIFEPALGLDRQRLLWLGLFAVFGLLAMVCLRRTRADRFAEMAAAARTAEAPPIATRRRLWWIYLAFVPSATLLAVTAHITTDIASFPLLWVLPLGVYLLTMIAAFSGHAVTIAGVTARPMVLAVIAALVVLVADSGDDHTTPLWAGLLVQFVLLAAVGLYGHARLAADRPHPARLTEFYLLMSVGGALGGLFNGIVAPLVFNDAYEYHAALLFALLMLPAAVRASGVAPRAFWRSRLVIPAAAFTWLLLAGLVSGRIEDPTTRLLLWLIPPGVLVYMGWRDRLAASGALAFPLLALLLDAVMNPSVMHQERTFFGVHRVERITETDTGLIFHRLLHGTTLHGIQLVGHPELEFMPRTYYHPAGPAGAAVGVVHDLRPRRARMALIGLGTGAMAAYARENDETITMEIDPAVLRIATDGRYFTHLLAASGTLDNRLGDGRLLLERSEAMGEPRFDLIVADAFSSDAIPTHLLTREAIRLGLDRLRPDGVLLIHISNRHLDIWPVLHATADAEGVDALLADDQGNTGRLAAIENIRYASTWVAMSRSPQTRQALIEANFHDVDPHRVVRPWTDQYSNLLSVLKALHPVGQR
jgi:SAM-dependent methyltransferase